MKAMNEITIDDGSKTYTIKNLSGDIIGELRFNPNDMNIRKRFDSVSDALSHLADSVDESMDADKIIDEMEQKVYEQIDFLFGGNVAEKCFAITSPFSMMANGEFFMVNVINAIGSIIKTETGESLKRVEKKIGKYTGKYHA